jgi:hypothetical protein
MKIKIKLIIIIWLFISFFNYYAIAQKDELIIINDHSILWETSDKNSNEKIRIPLFDKVIILDNNIILNRIFVKTGRGIKGWIDINNTSIIIKNNLKVVNLEEIELYISQIDGLKIEKEIVNDFTIAKLIYIEKVFNECYFISVSKYRRNFNDLINYIKEANIASGHDKEYVIPGKLIEYNNLKTFYISGFNSSEGFKYNSLIIRIDDNNSIDITIIYGGKNCKKNDNIDFIARKILFSIKLNGEQ